MKNDLISRKAAMEEISKQQTYKMFEGEDTVYLDANDVGSVIASLPPAQPESCDDTISRKAAIEIASGFCHPANIAKELAKLPSAQPEWNELMVICDNCGHAIHVKRQQGGNNG